MKNAMDRIDNWITAAPEAKHDWFCNCEVCHEHHDIQANYQDVDFECCTRDVEDMMAEKQWCRKKPKEHSQADMQDGICLVCLKEK